MKCTIPEISWHNRDPVLSLDVQPKTKGKDGQEIQRLATGGTDSHVLMWRITILPTGAAVVEFAADLTRHQKAVNVVRFSPSGEFLASGDDESAIIIWKLKTDRDLAEFGVNDEDGNTEQWLTMKVLRGHVEDVYDLAWSPDSTSLISGSVDNTAILWDVVKGTKIEILDDHKGFVQGVAWDPLNELVATLGGDRTLRTFSLRSKKPISSISRAVLPVPADSLVENLPVRLFHDDTFKSFFRRLCFSPDGNLLIAPSGHLREESINSDATFVFARHCLTRPCLYFPSLDQFTVAARCCPLLFKLRPSTEPDVIALPYRMVIAIAEQQSVALYDTQQSAPFALISSIHYARLTDLTWSSDGSLLVISSTDGYCSLVSFEMGELGEIYDPPATEKQTEVVETGNTEPTKKSTTEKQAEAAETKNKEQTDKSCTEKQVEVAKTGNSKPAKKSSTEKQVQVANTVNTKKSSARKPENEPADKKHHSNKRETQNDVEMILIDDDESAPSNTDELKDNLTRTEKQVNPAAMPEVLAVPLVTESAEKCVSPARLPITPGNGPRTPRRVAFTTLSSPKAKKRL